MSLQWQIPVKALSAWQPNVKSAKSGEKEIDMYDAIGEGMFAEGVTLKGVSAALKSYDGEDITVNINSAGGDMFEGLAIYNALREYDGKVTVKVVGLAASAASIIAMAGDEILMDESAFLMIHNAWTLAIGNKDDFKKLASDFEKFDDTMSKVYSSRSGVAVSEVAQMMQDETWISGADAIDLGFADGSLKAPDIVEDDEPEQARALRRVDVALAKAGVARSERREMIKELTSTPCATDTTPSASDEGFAAALSDLQAKINSLVKGEKHD